MDEEIKHHYYPGDGTKVVYTASEVVRLRAEVERMRAQIDAVQGIHWSRGDYCNECGGQAPCSTVEAITPSAADDA